MLSDTYYTPEELAKRFKLSISTIYNLIDKGEIPSIKLGKCYRIPQKELGRYLKLTGKELTPIVYRFADLIRSSSANKDVVDIILYGSYARGDYGVDSDIDILVILKKTSADVRDVVAGVSDEAMSLSGYEDFLSTIQMSLDQWKHASELHTPFYNSITKEGISIWKKQ